MKYVCLGKRYPHEKPQLDLNIRSKVDVKMASMKRALMTRQVTPIATLNGVISLRKTEIYLHADVELTLVLSNLFAIKICFVSSIFSSFRSFFSKCLSLGVTMFLWFF